MSTKTILLCRDELCISVRKMPKNIEELYESVGGLKREDVATLQQWLKMQPHLPELSDSRVAVFHHSCYYSNEATKKCIDSYYTTIAHAPEFFANLDPFSDDVLLQLKSFLLGPLPKLTPEGNRIVYSRCLDPDPSVYNFDLHCGIITALMDLDAHQNGCFDGHVIVLDMKGGTLAHLARVSLFSIKKIFFFVQEAMPMRLKQIHFLNPVPFMDKVMMMIRPFLKKELYDMIRIHNSTSITDFVAKECLPNSCGGTLGNLEDLAEAQVKRMQANADYILESFRKMSDESKRPEKLDGKNGLFGSEGTFKKLDID